MMKSLSGAVYNLINVCIEYALLCVVALAVAIGLVLWIPIQCLPKSVFGGEFRSGCLLLACWLSSSIDSASAEWIEVPPLRQVQTTQLGNVLADIESRMPTGHVYRDQDMVTWAHETTHGINSRLRVAQKRPRVNVFYVTHGRAIVLAEPRVKLAHVAAAVPPRLRGGVYQLYLQQSLRDWNDSPLYVLDEWMGYTNGTAALVDLRVLGLWRGGARSDTTEYMIEFAGYAAALLSVVERDDPSYAQLAELREFIRWSTERAERLAAAVKIQGDGYSPRHEQRWQAITEARQQGQIHALKNYIFTSDAMVGR